MEIEVKDKQKRVNIWLTHAESQDEALMESLKPIYREYKAKKYLVAVFASGDAAAFLVVNAFGTIVTVLAKGTLAGWATMAHFTWHYLLTEGEKAWVLRKLQLLREKISRKNG